MKILHTSDLHLNSKMDSKLGAEKAAERKRELIINFRRMTEIAKSEGCEAFIIAGDLFDSDSIPDSILKTTLDIISGASDITFLYLSGNHEKELILRCENLPRNLKIFGDDWTYFDIGNVRFAGRRECAPDMFKTLESAQRCEFLFAVLHGELRERSDYGGIIGMRELAESPINYAALGHYHSYSAKLCGKCHAVYCGTPLGRGFDEEGEKGFVIIELSDGLSYKFRKSAGRSMIIKDVELDGIYTTPALEEKIAEACGGISSADMVRARLVGHRSAEARFDLRLIEKRLEDRFYYFEIQDRSRLRIDPRDYEKDKSLKGEFIRLVLADENLNENEKDEIIKCGISALFGDGAFEY